MGDMTSRAADAAAYFEVKKDRLVQNQDGAWKITHTALELPAHIIAAHPGTRYIMALVEIGDDEEPINPKSKPASIQASDRGRANYESLTPGEQAVARSAILCGDPEFQSWLGANNKDDAAELLRRKLLIHSRSQIKADDKAFHRFIDLEGEFRDHQRYGSPR